jgi:protein involved in polysaccharide export with SLBB domain
MIYKLFKTSFCFALFAFAFITSSPAQNLPIPGINGIQNQIGSIGIGGIGGVMGGAGMNGGLGILSTKEIKGADPLVSSNTRVPIPVFTPLEPNYFQNFVLNVTGQNVPLYGANFFENIHQFEIGPKNEGISIGDITGNVSLYYPYAPFTNAPVSPEYSLGPGDQILIRAWGSVDINYQAVIDRNGLISIPKVGTFPLSGVKLSDAQGVIDQAISKQFKNYDLNVTLGQTRSITVYVVGQARRPGSYTLSSLSTLSSALFASGGPNNIGSMRHFQLKRSGKIISELDLYDFLSKGQVANDTKLIDGDVLVIPPALGYVALVGKLNRPFVFELKSDHEPLINLINLSGGLPLTTNQVSATLERFEPTQSQPRIVSNLLLDNNSTFLLQNGDLVNFQSINPEIANAITLRGNVAQPKRVPFKVGMRVHDLISNKSILISTKSVQLQNEVLFDINERERTQRSREQIPTDLLLDQSQQQIIMRSVAEGTKQLDNLKPLESKSGIAGLTSTNAVVANINVDNGESSVISLDKWRLQREERLLAQQPAITDFKRKSLPDQIGSLIDQVNFDYAVIERINRNDLSLSLLPFNLGNAIDFPESPDNLRLESGDVITVFSQDDIRVPISKRRINVRIEGEVLSPGIYQASPEDSLPQLIKRAGGLTKDAYLFGTGFYREDVRKTQLENLDKLLRRLESESNSSLSQLSQSLGASSDTLGLQARVSAAQQSQRSAIERIKNLKPEGRIALGLTPSELNNIEDLPKLKLQNGDRVLVPPKADFVYVYGSVNTESALLYKKGLKTSDYLSVAGVTSGADKQAVILLRADGTSLSSTGSWRNQVLDAEILPGDTIVMPEKLDRESVWSSVFRNTLGATQIFYQLGLGAAAVKTLRQ